VLDNQDQPGTATLRLKALMPNADRGLWPKRVVKARMLATPARNAIFIPAVAGTGGPQGTSSTRSGPTRRADEAGDDFALTPPGDIAVIARPRRGEQVIIEARTSPAGGRVAPSGPNRPGGAPCHIRGRGPGSDRARASAARPTPREVQSPDAAPPAGGPSGRRHGAAAPAGAAAQRRR